MHNIKFQFLFLFLLLPSLYSTERVVWVAAFNYYPAIFQDKDNAIKGIFVDTLNYIGEREDILFEFQYGTWNEGIERLKTGEVDLLTSVRYTTERALYLDYCPTPLCTVWGVIYTRSSNPIDSILKMDGLKIGIMKDDLNGAHFKNLANNFGVSCEYIEYTHFEDIFKAIQTGEIEAGVANVIYGSARYKDFNLRPTSVVFNPFDIYFAVAKGKNSDLLALLNKYLRDWSTEKNSYYLQVRTKWLFGEKSTYYPRKKVLIVLAISLGITALLIIFVTLIAKKRFEILKKKQERTESLFKNISDNLENGFIYQLELANDNETRKFLYVSSSVEQITGYTSLEIVSDPKLLYNAVHPLDKQMLASKEAEALTNITILNCEFRLIHKNGSTRWIHITSIPHKDSNQQLIWDAIAIDNTTQREREIDSNRLKELLFQSQKMEAIGQLAGGIAHDFNNVLAGIMGATEILISEKMEENQRNEYLEMIYSSANRAAELTAKLLAFSCKSVKNFAAIDCGQVVQLTVQILKHTLNKNIDLRVINNAERPVVKGDSTLLQNALINIAINASHAMQGGGEILFTLKNVTLNKSFCEKSTFDIKPGDYLELVIEDTGTGISPEVLPHIFEPFFTTKPKSKGTGLGLSAVYGTLQEHEGAITVFSELKKGTRFHLYLPVTNAEPSLQTETTETTKGAGTVLIIDDEATLRITSATLLKSMGYQTLCASNGVEGIEIFKSSNTKIDAVLLDMIMPVMGGKETFRKLREIDKDISVIVCTGFANEEELEEIKSEGIYGFLSKPFQKKDLCEMIAGATKRK